MPALDYLSRFDPSTARSSRDINFENAVKFRGAKTVADLLNPGMPAVNRDPGWDAFDGGVARAAQDAGDDGRGFSMNMSGIGQSGGGAATTDPFGSGARAIAGNAALGNYADSSKANALSLRALQAQARISEDKAAEADWADDDVTKREKTAQDIERAGSIADFGRGQQVKDAANSADVYQAGQPARRAAAYDTLQTAKEMFPYGKESTDLQKAQIEADAKKKEAATNKAREDSAALRSLTDLARTRSTLPQEIDDPTGKKEGGFFGMGQHAVRVPNPAYDDLGDAMDAAYHVLGQQAPGAAPAGDKVMSQDDLAAFAQQNRMSPQDAQALAQRYGWTVR